MDIRLFDSELKVMELVWEHEEISAKELAVLLKQNVGWSKTTSYTVIKKCIDKGALARKEPGFLCRAILSKEAVQVSETTELIDKFYGGAADQLVACLLSQKALSQEEISSLQKLLSDQK